MSLQRVFESARKLGVPVIVTDPAGREPMVVMPLEQFEAMTDEGMTTDGKELDIEKLLAEQAAEVAKARMDEVAAGLKPAPSKADENHEISLEERFYLEPVDDETAI